ncbi:cysteine desulfurase family protein [Haloplasma contractile]|uniref:Cysteine desulfurase IscS 2 protein n=1 Tax=Haloplasma contractile SSD-17B TaxID=1033810 RepID=U2EG91_9MOLU|nr:cysteine desulfurase family protein [Haloplasma contractile]ERJ13636.1 Putative cysteine desulfurase IscS 2 protein [Haloplasma contractile SSD-17B]
MIYLDYTSTTPPREEVLETYNIVSKKYWGNPSALHNFGAEAEHLLKKSRSQILEVLNLKNYEVALTSCATEANNLAIKGVCNQHKWRGRHVITTSIEHASVYSVFRELEENGFDVTYLPVNRDGRISVEDLKKALRKDTILVSIMHVNNEVGTIMPIEEIGQVLKNYPKIIFHADIVQSLGKINVDLETYKVDLASMSAHKIYGLKGTGALFYRKGLELAPQITGGPQEKKLRAGTTDTASAVSLAKAIRLIMEERDSNYDYVLGLNKKVRSILESCDGVVINTPEEAASPFILNFSVQGIKPETFVHALGERGIYVSTKSACSSKSSKPSRILKAMGLPKEISNYSIRISLSHLTTNQQIDTLEKELPQLIHALK